MRPIPSATTWGRLLEFVTRPEVRGVLGELWHRIQGVEFEALLVCDLEGRAVRLSTEEFRNLSMHVLYSGENTEAVVGAPRPTNDRK